MKDQRMITNQTLAVTRAVFNLGFHAAVSPTNKRKITTAAPKIKKRKISNGQMLWPNKREEVQSISQRFLPDKSSMKRCGWKASHSLSLGTRLLFFSLLGFIFFFANRRSVRHGTLLLNGFPRWISWTLSF